MKKALLILAALCVMLLPAAHGMPYTKADASGEGLKMADPLEGIWKPADDPQASFAYRLPQFEPDSECAVRINRYYQEYAERFPYSNLDPSSIEYEIAAFDNRYLSVLLHGFTEGGQGTAEELRADTFALDGIYAGEKITLSQLLGLEQTQDESILDFTVYRLIWQIVEREIQNAENDYLGHVTQEDVIETLHPEHDFYLDQHGNILFYIQAGEIAGEIAGVLTFGFAPSELLDALWNEAPVGN